MWKAIPMLNTLQHDCGLAFRVSALPQVSTTRFIKVVLYREIGVEYIMDSPNSKACIATRPLICL